MWCYERVQNQCSLVKGTMQDAIRERAFSFWLVFLHNDEACSLKLNSWSTLTSTNISYLLLLTVSLPIFICKLSLVLYMSKWYLSGLFFILLFLKYCNSVSAAFSNIIRTSGTFNQYYMRCCCPRSLPQEYHGGTKGDGMKIY